MIYPLEIEIEETGDITLTDATAVFADRETDEVLVNFDTIAITADGNRIPVQGFYCTASRELIEERDRIEYERLNDPDRAVVNNPAYVEVI